MTVLSTPNLHHLLRRTEFVAKPDRIAALASGTLEDAVDDVLNFALNSNPQLPEYLLTNDTEDGWGQYVYSTQWWFDRMLNAARPLQERLCFFWHGHFTSSWWDASGQARHMMSQNQLYRVLAAGNYIDLVQQMSLEPAMLVYLSNAQNYAGEPNENFARELMELFTLGVGNYTEADVQAAARAWTGHNADWPEYDYVFYGDRHDDGQKTFFGTTKNWDGPDIVNEILRDNPAKQLIAAKYICKKLWEFFAYQNPDAGLVSALANVLIANNMELKPMLRELLLRPEFYSVTAQQGSVKTPTDLFVSLAYYTGLNFDQLGVAWRGQYLGQQIFQPPNVAGWKLNSYWLNTSALSARAGLARDLAWAMRQGDAYEYLHALSDAQVVDDMLGVFGIDNVTTTTRQALIAWVGAERASVEWESWWLPSNIITMIALVPEFHML